MLQAERLQQLAHVRHEEEGRVAAVLEQRQHDAERSEKELQRLRNESSELRELQEHIKTAKAGIAGYHSGAGAGWHNGWGKGLQECRSRSKLPSCPLVLELPSLWDLKAGSEALLTPGGQARPLASSMAADPRRWHMLALHVGSACKLDQCAANWEARCPREGSSSQQPRLRQQLCLQPRQCHRLQPP